MMTLGDEAGEKEKSQSALNFHRRRPFEDALREATDNAEEWGAPSTMYVVQGTLEEVQELLIRQL
jgi:hypothetical protein